MAELTERLIKMGRELGYSGADLQMFLKEEKAEIKEREWEEKEREERRLRREGEEQERQAQLQLVKINAGIEIARATKPKLKDSSYEFLSKVLKMAPFSESKGDTMDTFIFRFEMLVKIGLMTQNFWLCQIFSLENHFEFCRHNHWNNKTTTV